MESEVVRAGEAAAAVVALEGLRTCVFTEVPREFVGPREPPLAALPGTPVRLLPCVCPLVGLEVRGFRVDFLTAWEEALVHPSLGIRGRVCCPSVHAHAHVPDAHTEATAVVAAASLEGQGGGEGYKLWHL